MNRRGFLKSGIALGAMAGAMTMPQFAFAAGETIKVGILHSLSGTMAISETTLKDVMLMLIEHQNAKGGLLGKKLEAVVVDPASNWPLFAEKAEELRDFCRQSGLTQWKVPRELRIVDELPHSPTGKILKRVLAERLE